ncbi:MAG: GYD domain-containing protein [Chloroflexota bacterium]|nr:MAG: GYD family protein [Chloroflexota bacterium]
MATYIVLGKFTDEGAKDIRNIRERAEGNMQRGKQLGLNPKGWYMTMGRYDFVVVLEGPDDETMAAQVLGVGTRGGSRTETLRAFPLDEVETIIQKLS